VSRACSSGEPAAEQLVLQALPINRLGVAFLCGAAVIPASAAVLVDVLAAIVAPAPGAAARSAAFWLGPGFAAPSADVPVSAAAYVATDAMGSVLTLANSSGTAQARKMK
jgi:hypothetical protein